jgi:hypothetical protein
MIIMNFNENLGKRATYTGITRTIARNGTMCLINICHDGNMIRDHMWFNERDAGKGLNTLRDMGYGKVEFTAVAYKYPKRNRETGKTTFQIGLGELRDIKRP